MSIAVLAREAGYTVDSDVLNGTTKIYTPELMEIEFLILRRGKESESALKTNLGVKAQALRHLTIMLDYTVTVDVFGMKLTVPVPEAYVLHKIVINSERGRKAEKDRQAILNLLPKTDRVKLCEIYSSMSKNEKRTVNTFISSNCPEYM